jgi:malate synthase
VPAAFEMDAILYELRDHSAGLNAGRWDYIFSTIKRFRSRPDFVLPDRSAVTMTVPFMRAYTELLVKTCHRRGAHAMGGMAAVIPSRTDEEANRKAFEAVRADKEREAGDGFDGTWVAHPDSVSVATEAFDAVLGERPNQVDRQRDDVSVEADDLLSVAMTPGEVTETGLRSNVNVGIQYLSSWLRGNGAAGIYGLMEDAATAEISRAQVWQWCHHKARIQGGPVIDDALVERLLEEELTKIKDTVGEERYGVGRYTEAAALLRELVLADEFTEFLTLPAYERVTTRTGRTA